MQTELGRFRRPRYLEIGVAAGHLFLHVRAHEKVAVDPVDLIPRWKWLAHPNTALRGRFLRKTSDEFFSSLGSEEKFDVVFVDGLHTFEQSRRDVANALGHLAPDGVVLVHDCNPTDPNAAGSDPEAARGADWCGEVWKTIAELRAVRDDVVVETLDFDYGIGIIRPGTARERIGPIDVAALTYEDLDRRRVELLGLRRFSGAPVE